MKKKVLLSSILTIALCLCLIAGSTFALFTSQTQVDITVKAAKVKMEASVSELKLYSVKATANGTIVDEFGGKYEYVDRTADQTFANGGTATFDTGVLTLDRITPGDKVSFDVTGANTSDVTIQYRYKVECIGGELLMSGLLVTIEGVTYPILDSYTSVWNTLTPGTDISPKPIVIELPVTAGNDYQEQNVEIRVTVEAVQGNADVDGSVPVVKFLDGYTADLNGQTLTDYIAINGNNALANGTVVLDYVGVENFGNLTMDNMTIAAGANGYTSLGYAMNSKNGATTVLNNVDVAASNGAFGVTGGANLTYNSGRVYMYSTNTSGRYMFYVAGEGSVATINGGEFVDFTYIPEGFTTTQNQKRAYAYVDTGATLYINGGTFGKASTRSGYTAGLLGSGTIIITGGTFGFDPSKWVADGYKATKVGAQWIVTSNNTVVTPDQLDGLLADPSVSVIELATDLTATIGDLSNKTINANGKDVALTFTGNLDNVVVTGIVETTGGNSINLKAATGTITILNSELMSAGGTSEAAILAGPNANMVIDNCTISSAEGVKGYGVYNSGASGAITITNTTFNGFKSWAIQINNAVNGDLLIDGCTFNTPDGVLKVLSGVNGNATFTNNTMIGCKGHDGAGEAALVVSTSSKWKPLSCTGVKTISGNTLDGAEWTQD